MFISVLLLSLILSGCQLIEQPAEAGETMRVHFLNVGQGDSVLIETPNDKYMLIDGGDKGSGKEIVAYLHEQGIQKLDYVVATHPDADHIGGLIDVIKSVEITNWLDSGKEHTSQTYLEMLTLIDDKDINFDVPAANDEILLDDNINIEVLYADEAASDNNDASLVLKVVYGDSSFLLTGDAGVAIEKVLMTEDIDVDVLKAGHHGSNTSSSEAFIKKVSPEITILSYGQNNKYGHPHKEVTDILTEQDSLIYATAQSGTIVVETDGVNLSVDDADVWTADGEETTKPIISAGGQQTVRIANKDALGEAVSIENTGTTAVDLSGWTLVSVQGNQRYTFEDYTLAAGKTVHITSGDNDRSGGAYLHWSSRQIWANTGDEAQLLNAEGDVVHAID